MRDYGKVSAKFWVGETGKALRGNMEAQIVALYLMTCPTSEMTGVFHCPLMYIGHETGLGVEGASKGLARLYEADFCTFDPLSDWVFVHEMAKYQIGTELKVNDNQVKGVKRAYANMPDGLMRRGFYERYSESFHLDPEPDIGGKKARGLQGPLKPRAGTRTGADQKPPHTPQAGQKVKSAIEFKTYLDCCKAENKKPIPETDTVFDYASEAGIDRDFLGLHWLEFKDRYSEPGAKRYKDWPAVFRKSVRGNWFKLWYKKGNCYELTTVGQQARSVHDGRKAA